MSQFMTLCLFFFFTVALSAPLNSRTVFNPPITSPNAKTIWTVGKVETVTWNATGIPAGAMGKIVLGFLTSDSENLSNTSLASGFNLTDGKVDITVPQVVNRPNYIVVLFGDSGNISPEFTIQGGSDPSSASGASSASNAATSPPSTGSTDRPTTSLSRTGGLSITPSPPIATASSSFAPVSTATAPPSGPGSSSTSLPTSSLPTSSSAVTSPAPSPSPNAGWSMNNLKNHHVQMMIPVVALLLFI